MKLFQCHGAKPEAVIDPNAFRTPLGHVRLEATVDGMTVTNEQPVESHRLPADGWLAGWHQPNYDLELLVCRPAFQHPFWGTPGKPLTDCWAGLWRIRANKDLGPCIFTAAWAEGYTWQTGGPESGERLYAKTWDDAQTEVSIGTEDEEAFEARTQRKDWLPSQWASYFRPITGNPEWDWRTIGFWQHGIHEELGDRGLALPMPSLKTNQQCQVHFVVAWSPYDEQGVTTWLAVDLKARDILNSAVCS